ncbi:MAG: family 10 glycosylhydrolase [Armatimonadetes bacterium]|nr:family 10 glycosylhydrolase [Armatimonadota bacterium]
MLICALLFAAGLSQPGQVPPSRFQPVWPLVGLPSVRVDYLRAKEGVAQEFAYRDRLQARVLWIDGTANLDRCSTDEKICELLRKVAEVGFNTVVYDVKPIVGRTLYPSEHAEKMTEWKGQSMPEEFDPLAAMVREAAANGLSLFVSLNAFSEGHSFSKRYEDDPDTLFGKAGWGYEHPELQTHQYRPTPVLAAVSGRGISLSRVLNEWDGSAAVYSTVRGLPKADWYIALDEDGFVLSSSSDKPKTGRSFVAVTGETVKTAKEAFPAGTFARVVSFADFVPIADDHRQIPLMMNPHHPEVQARAMLFVEEVLSRYDVDGILFDDRLRFGGLNADFSPYTRDEFESYVGRSVHWPDEIYRVTYDVRLRQGIDPGPLFDAWLTWRAQAMADWVASVRLRMDEIKPGTLFGIYAGSWYGSYTQYGNNYGSAQLSAGFPFLTRHYRQTGFASSLDVLITGCYYKVPTIVDAMKGGLPIGRTVEAAGILSNRVALDQCWTYAGIMLADFDGNPRLLGDALQAAAATTQGVMVFDLSHDIDQFWPVFSLAFSTPAKAPHQVPGLLERVRRHRLTLLANGYKDPPFPFFPGAPGAGF